MKIFEEASGSFAEKVNFVDENNVFVGYDLAQDCCEDAGWFISDKVEKTTEDDHTCSVDVDKYVFDTEFFESKDVYDNDDYEGMAIFRLVAGKDEKFLHLYNCHNGYYGHGFYFKVGEETKESGTL